MATHVLVRCDRCDVTAEPEAGESLPVNWYRIQAWQQEPFETVEGSRPERTGEWHLCDACGAEQWPAGAEQ